MTDVDPVALKDPNRDVATDAHVEAAAGDESEARVRSRRSSGGLSD